MFIKNVLVDEKSMNGIAKCNVHAHSRIVNFTVCTLKWRGVLLAQTIRLKLNLVMQYLLLVYVVFISFSL